MHLLCRLPRRKFPNPTFLGLAVPEVGKVKNHCRRVKPVQIKTKKEVPAHCHSLPWHSGSAKCHHQSELSVWITSQLKIKLMTVWKVRWFGDIPSADSSLFEANVVRRENNLHTKCFPGCANLRCKYRLAGKCYVIDHSSNAMFSCHKVFAVVCTSSEHLRHHREVDAAQIGLITCITLFEEYSWQTPINYYILWPFHQNNAVIPVISSSYFNTSLCDDSRATHLIETWL